MPSFQGQELQISKVVDWFFLEFYLLLQMSVVELTVKQETWRNGLVKRRQEMSIAFEAMKF